MLMDVFRAIVNKFFYKKKKINILTTLFISHKNDIKAFLK